jgi:hypothetical protein
MNGNNGNAGVELSADVWQAVSNAATKEVAKIRTGQKVFPTTMLDGDPAELQDESIDFRNFSFREEFTKQLIEIYHEFPPTGTRVTEDAAGKTCQTLSRMPAKALSLTVDMVIFQGHDGNLRSLHEDQGEAAAYGLLEEASLSEIPETPYGSGG